MTGLFKKSRGRAGLRAIIALAALLATACAPVPGYLVDIFPEMHYAPSYRPQEPPRLTQPVDSVPMVGKEVPLTLAEAADLRNPLPQNDQVMQRAVYVFQTNCAICHGPTGRGNGPMAERFAREQATPPPDFASPRVLSRSDGELFFFITNGIGFMPPIGSLLLPEDRWAVVYFIHATQ